MRSIEFDLGACCDLEGKRQDGNFRMQDEVQEARLQNRQQKLRRRLNQSLRRDLTPRQRQVMLLYYGDQLTMEEIGHRLGVGRSAVCRCLARARKRLNYALEPYLEDWT